ncbi:hypothetical protein OS493_019312 [Desmophyllum pertusum]|uniref:Uncharacterized protein n=1 Tax=Desmophyllum pertusum TaxID=174260 RepID=A0A9X0D975_9CNID|nr:hypothetical protein OS493_019312 [Desmophyllum pertusum]
MNALIDTVLKQHQSTEDSAANNAENKESPPTNRKRKLQFNASENGESEKSVASDKKQRTGGKKQKGPKVKHVAMEKKKTHLPKLLKRRHPNQLAIEKRRSSPRHSCR